MPAGVVDDFLPTNVGQLRQRWFAVLQTAAAAAAAWQLSLLAPIGTQAPIYSTLAVVTGMNAKPGNRGKWMLQVTLGAILGVLVANVVEFVPGEDVNQIFLAILIAISIALLFYTQNWFLINAAAGAVIPLANESAAHGFAFAVGWQALIALGVALTFTQLLFPANAKGNVASDLRQALHGVADGLRGIATLLSGGQDADPVELVEQLDDQLSDLDEDVSQARNTTRLAPLRWRQREDIERYAKAVPSIKLAVDDLGALAHLVSRAVEDSDDGLPAGDLADSASRLGDVAGVLAQSLDDVSPLADCRQRATVLTDGISHGRTSPRLTAAAVELQEIARDLAATAEGLAG